MNSEEVVLREGKQLMTVNLLFFEVESKKKNVYFMIFLWDILASMILITTGAYFSIFPKGHITTIFNYFIPFLIFAGSVYFLIMMDHQLKFDFSWKFFGYGAFRL